MLGQFQTLFFILDTFLFYGYPHWAIHIVLREKSYLARERYSKPWLFCRHIASLVTSSLITYSLYFWKHTEQAWMDKISLFPLFIFLFATCIQRILVSSIYFLF